MFFWPLPPLLARVAGNIEVLGFNVRQRKSYLKKSPPPASPQAAKLSSLLTSRMLAEPPYSWSLTLTSGPEWTEHWRHQGRKAKRLNLQAQAPRASQHLQTQEPRNRLPHDLLRCLM